ncbi:MAG: polysaccharide deacetylase family protein [Pseudomonadota bacterium]|nr:polysaccharide deacetylase family protein [Pseudomonadota bacterium]
MRSRILGYHEIVEGPSDSFYSLSAEQFSHQLAVFNALATAGGPAVDITFDDGHASNARVAAPLLHAHARTARFFVTAGWIGQREGFMSWAELGELARQGHQVGCHGLTHRFLTQLDTADLRAELRDARRLLEDRLGQAVTGISLPGGRCNRRVLDMCAETGYQRVYGSVPWKEGGDRAGIAFEGRLVMNRKMSQAWLQRYVRGDLAPYLAIRTLHTTRETLKSLLGDRLYHRAWSLLTGRSGMQANAR